MRLWWPQGVCSISDWIPSHELESLLRGPNESRWDRRQRVLHAWDSCAISLVASQNGPDLPAGIKLFEHECPQEELRRGVGTARPFLIHRPAKWRYLEGIVDFANIKPGVIALANLLLVYQPLECDEDRHDLQDL